MSRTVSGLFPNFESAGRAIEALQALGFDNQELSVLTADTTTGDMTTKAAESRVTDSNAPEGASVGAGVGSAVGAAVAGLAAVGSVTATGGVGLLATGPLIAGLAGAGVGGAAGGLIGGLMGLGFLEKDAKKVDAKVREGSILVDVRTPEHRKKEVEEALEKSKAEQIIMH